MKKGNKIQKKKVEEGETKSAEDHEMLDNMNAAQAKWESEGKQIKVNFKYTCKKKEGRRSQSLEEHSKGFATQGKGDNECSREEQVHWYLHVGGEKKKKKGRRLKTEKIICKNTDGVKLGVQGEDSSEFV